MTNILNNRRSQTLWGLGALLGLGLCAVGCGDGRKPVYPVRGRVLFGDRPVARALVTFHPVGDRSPEAAHPSAETDEQGWFDLSTFVKGDGAPEGQYQVAVSQYLATRNKGGGGGDDYVTVNYLPDRYSRADSSKLTATVSRGPNELPPFQLQAK
jgi:hypothetical protein